MSLRYRLFLWITITFLAAGAVDYILEGYTTKKELDQAQARLKNKIIQISEDKRQHIEKFLATSIAENQALLDVLLNQLTQYFLQVEHFAPIRANEIRGTWIDTAAILANNKWIDFIQNTIEGNVASCIAPPVAKLDQAYVVPIQQEFAWIFLSHDWDKKKAFIGIKIPIEYKPAYKQPEEEQIILRRGQIPDGFILFEVEDLVNLSEKALQAPIFHSDPQNINSLLVVPWGEGYQVRMDIFLNSFLKARRYLQQGIKGPTDAEIEQAQYQVDKGVINHEIEMISSSDTTLSSPFIQQRLDQITIHYHQVYMTWTIAAFFDTGIFGNQLFDPPAPRGMSINAVGELQGIGIHTTDACYPTQFLNDAAYYQQNHDPNNLSHLGNSVAVFKGPCHHVYLGNTAKLLARDNKEEKQGYLSVAINGDTILQRLVETVGQFAMIVHDGQIFGAYSQDGKRVNLEGNADLPLSEMLLKKTGIIRWRGIDYFFTHTVPFSSIDLHFIMLNPVAVEFAFTQFLVEGAIQVVNSILFNVHVIGFTMMVLVLCLLHNIARRITQPISQLAQAAKKVGEGKFENVQIPQPDGEGTKDEVAILCRAFSGMVKGLQEKEKVKAVLDKVVSQEIAQEILKGNIHLGGEEKRVTVFFADIRNFTHMTQEMKPKEVINLLNTCMTKISTIIDKNGGVIDKYVGDATMALFGAPVPCSDSAYQAIRSAVEIIIEIKRWNTERVAEGLPPLEMGIGIHTGLVLAGNMGAENRLNYTVIGSNVNLASRLCTSAEGMQIRISADTWDEPGVKEKFTVESLGATALKGFDQPVDIFNVTGFA